MSESKKSNENEQSNSTNNVQKIIKDYISPFWRKFKKEFLDDPVLRACVIIIITIAICGSFFSILNNTYQHDAQEINWHDFVEKYFVNLMRKIVYFMETFKFQLFVQRLGR